MKNKISCFGRYLIHSNGDIFSLNSRKMLKPYLTKKGYLRINLFINKKRKGFLIHRLIAKAFIPNPLNLKTVNHKDENKQNNKSTNLEWLSNTDNMRYSSYRYRGNNAKYHKLTEKQVSEIRDIKRLNPRFTFRKISRMYGVYSTTIADIIRHINWKHI